MKDSSSGFTERKAKFDEQKQVISLISVLCCDIPQMVVNDYFITTCSFLSALTYVEYLKIFSSSCNAIGLLAMACYTLFTNLKKHTKVSAKLITIVLFLLSTVTASFSIYSASHWSFYKVPTIEAGQKLQSNLITLHDEKLLTLEAAVVSLKEKESLHFSFCCDTTLYQPSIEVLDQVANSWENYTFDCKTVDTEIGAIFQTDTFSKDQTVTFYYLVRYLFANTTHFQWWSPISATLLQFEPKITGIREDGCRPDIKWQKADQTEWSEPVHAFPQDLVKRRNLKTEVQNVMRVVNESCGVRTELHLSMLQNSTGYIKLPPFPGLVASREIYPIGGGKPGVATLFPTGLTMCFKFSQIGRQPTYVNAFGDLSILHWGISMLSWATPFDKSYWSGSAYYGRISDKFVCTMPPQISLLVDPSKQIQKKLNHLIIDAVNTQSLPG